jgi:hypothetical protein
MSEAEEKLSTRDAVVQWMGTSFGDEHEAEEALIEIIKAARAAERERCAKMVGEVASAYRHDPGMTGANMRRIGADLLVDGLAGLIRILPEEET